MKKQEVQAKLTFKRKTLAQLNDSELSAVNGGSIINAVVSAVASFTNNTAMSATALDGAKLTFAITLNVSK